jgi:hypothetical protein
MLRSVRYMSKNKRRQNKYGLPPPKRSRNKTMGKTLRWLNRSLDTIWKKRCKDRPCRCVTTSDPATDWFKIHQYDDNSQSQLQQYRTSVLKISMANTSYLRSREQIHQSGFSTNYQNVYGIKLKPITVKNPQAKCYCENLSWKITTWIKWIHGKES